ncbi:MULTISPECIES: hypothetical protein [Methanothermobacter]|uniref:Uncharacterized protein n=1 Tax=Methanothermobacter marburgensis (strain ATCC BAA-927 / DSM 2133 / JCM 14651 / NBRC 100331 / OCM 82 / Marburg) TaxID=79929 RepID=D9PYQ5_METTM|nr:MULTISPECIES: hypothetical protein [Methanothermobacter]ADL59353.1 conserved hypothetical protein [Methanothermobacter marburgensis str. Marburg]QEF94493.1 hypothetical protein FVF72_04590 [Methanothermobacter sp. KEPCO-1]QHN07641.1 hypothetical protein FZP68_02015 [Methanothermobacter sp. THM-2]WBF09841.1 hypothetical protein ISG34_08810 [Methanothermobacter marburgensis]
MDDGGYVMAGFSLLLMVPAMILALMILSIDDSSVERSADRSLSESMTGALWDIRDSIPVITREVLNGTAQEAINGTLPPDLDARARVRAGVQGRIDRLCAVHRNMNLSCRVNSVEGATDDPFCIEVNSTVDIRAGKIHHTENISVRVPVEDLPDPLPFRVLGRLQHNETSIEYGRSLMDHLSSGNREAYDGASGPFLIRRCPYEPYTIHGSSGVLYTCLLNGYYHESHDGSCYLCRLEGKTSCPHLGLETFIIPSGNFEEAPVSVDHVLFTTAYAGELHNVSGFIIYLDGAHRKKYGVIQ